MKTIGMLGGMSWESSLEYYRIVNESVKARLGGYHSANCLMYSVDFDEIETLQHQDRWDELTEMMIDAAKRIEAGGAELLIICTNTMHMMAPEMQAAIDIPLLHIADAAGEAIKAQGLHTVGLLGTKFTMEGDFYRKRLNERFVLEVLIPDEADRETVHNTIYGELVKGVINPDSRQAFLAIIQRLKAKGAQGVILGCTEIPLLVKQADMDIPVFDTTRIHAEAAVDWALR
ncbi:MAG: aspartate/glutamate racemase family protein [Anaerolineaceae bacterium]|nr:aspartate/glutamate racemase family protein [Anaerolineaceae bacterium]